MPFYFKQEHDECYQSFFVTIVTCLYDNATNMEHGIWKSRLLFRIGISPMDQSAKCIFSEARTE